jgi:hypothetical protein
MKILQISIVLALGAALTAPAVAQAPLAPTRGVFVPDRSLGGVSLGLTKAEVNERWGSSYGVCRNCARETWYFNLKPFEPQGAGVEFNRGRVARVFTVWRPLGWRTNDGLELGTEVEELRQMVPRLEVRPCADYTAYLSKAQRATNAYYVFRGRLWGFGLMVRGLSPCL